MACMRDGARVTLRPLAAAEAVGNRSVQVQEPIFLNTKTLRQHKSHGYNVTDIHGI